MSRSFWTVLILCILVLRGVSGAIPITEGDSPNPLTEYMHSIQQGIRPSNEPEVISDSWAKTGPLLQSYLGDPEAKTRHGAYLLMHRMLKKKQDPTERKAIVENMVVGLEDRDHYIWGSVGNFLLTLNREDFSEKSKEHLSLFLGMRMNDRSVDLLLLELCIRVLGIADVKTSANALKSIVERENEQHSTLGIIPWYGSLRWASLRALARMGDQESIQKCIELVRSENNEATLVWHVIPDLAYVRQPAIVALLSEYLMQNRKPPIEGDVVHPSYAQAAARSLAEMIDDCPLAKEIRYPSEGQIIELRLWIDQQNLWSLIR